MKNLAISILFLISVSFTACTSQSSNAIKSEDAQAFKTEIEKTPGTVLDVRTMEEFQQGHLPNAVNMDYYDDNFSKNIESLDKEKPVYVYCAKGGRSAKAADIMQEAGFKNIYNLDCGYDCWSEAGLPVAK